MHRTLVCFVACLYARDESPKSFQDSRQRRPPPACQTSRTLCVDPHRGKHSAEQSDPSGGPHAVGRPRIAPHSFTHHDDAHTSSRARRGGGRVVGGLVLAGRAQKSSVGTVWRLPVQRHLQRRALCAAEARSASPRCTAVPSGASWSAPSALRGASEGGTGGPATRPIEADVPPIRPGHGDARGARGGL